MSSSGESVREPADLRAQGAQVAHALDDVARAGLALGAQHGRALADAAQGLAQVAAAADERHLEACFSMWKSSSAGVRTSLSSMKSTSSASRMRASMKCPMRHLAITGMLTAAWMDLIISGSLARATPPSLRIWAGTRSSAMTAVAPASCAMRACSALTTSMMTPPLSISARPTLAGKVETSTG
jgi:hypothetical protein